MALWLTLVRDTKMTKGSYLINGGQSCTSDLMQNLKFENWKLSILYVSSKDLAIFFATTKLRCWTLSIILAQGFKQTGSKSTLKHSYPYTRTSVDMNGTLKFVNYKVGGTQNPHSFTEAKYFFDLFAWKYILMHTKPENITQFDIFYTFVKP